MLSNEAIKNGDIFWNWNTDLGSAFVGYGFYTLGSPFFWISLLFPSSFFPYLIGPLLILKSGVAGLTAYAFLQRYVANKNYAVIASILYALSGYQSVNVLYNHFHDVVALFPLLLFTLDEFMENRRIGWFSLAVALNALVNFVFFAGEVVFVIIYFICRYLIPDFRQTLKRLPLCALEAVLGLGLSCFLILPSVFMVQTNPRLEGGFSEFPTHFSLQEYLRLIKNVLLPGDSQGIPTAFKAAYDSQSAFLPFFSLSLVITWMLKKRNFVTGLLLALAGMCAFPLLNSLFYLGKEYGKFRWLYMLLLIMALATAMALDHLDELPLHWGMGITFGGTLLYSLLLLVSPLLRDGNSYIQFMPPFLIQSALALSGIAVAWLILSLLHKKKAFLPVLTVCVIVFSSSAMSFNIYRMRSTDASAIWLNDNYIAPALEMELPQDPDARFKFPSVNQGLMAGVPALPCFNSSVSGGIFELYSNMGLYRGHGNVPLLENEYLRHLLSVKYVVNTEPIDALPLVSQYSGKTSTFYVYENTRALPVGYTYDTYITQENFLKLPVKTRQLVLCQALIVHQEDTGRLKGLTPITDQQIENMTEAKADEALENRRRESSTTFSRDQKGFSSVIESDTEKMAFFSVTYDTGWSATVNGQDVPVLNSNGMMAVPISAGENRIVFTYKVPWATAGLFVSLTAAAGWFVYVFLVHRIRKKTRSVV